jgi:hypothetical protein
MDQLFLKWRPISAVGIFCWMLLLQLLLRVGAIWKSTDSVSDQINLWRKRRLNRQLHVAQSQSGRCLSQSWGVLFKNIRAVPAMKRMNHQ